VGESVTLSVTLRDGAGNPLTGRAVSWSTADAGAVSLSSTSGTTVTATGVAARAGAVRITATSEGRSGTADVTVQGVEPPGAVASVTVAASPARVNVGSSVSFSATLRDAAGAIVTGRSVQWRSSDASRLQLTASSGATATGVGVAAGAGVRVSATSEGVEGSVQVEVVASLSPPAAPSNLVAQMQTDTLASLAWADNSADETEFRIEWKTGASGTWGHYATVQAGFTLAVATPLRSPNTYYFRVRACNAGGCSGSSNEAPVTPPSPCLAPNAAAFFWTENYPDNTRVTRGTTFEKTWTIKNTGSCAWTGTFALRYQSNTRGVISTSQAPVYVQGTILPQGMFTFRVPMRAPSAAGTYREDWRLTDANGSTVMVHQSQTVWIQIIVP
jgi:hypothetical protein